MTEDHSNDIHYSQVYKEKFYKIVNEQFAQAAKVKAQVRVSKGRIRAKANEIYHFKNADQMFEEVFKVLNKTSNLSRNDREFIKRIDSEVIVLIFNERDQAIKESEERNKKSESNEEVQS